MGGGAGNRSGTESGAGSTVAYLDRSGGSAPGTTVRLASRRRRTGRGRLAVSGLAAGEGLGDASAVGPFGCSVA